MKWTYRTVVFQQSFRIWFGWHHERMQHRNWYYLVLFGVSICVRRPTWEERAADSVSQRWSL
jgi:hypothetical protein